MRVFAWIALIVAWGGGIAGAVYLGMHEHPWLAVIVLCVALSATVKTSD